MRLSLVLCQQHIGRMTRKHWYLQGKKLVLPTRAQENVERRGYEVLDGVTNFVHVKEKEISFKVHGAYDKEPSKDSNHPDYKDEPCHIYKDNDALLGGLKQAQVLTNTVLMSEEMPNDILSRESKMNIPQYIHDKFQEQILLSCVYDAEQKKLPKRKDPNKPAWNFPRDYGITDSRKNNLLCLHLATNCEQLAARRDMSMVSDFKLSVPLKAHGRQIQFEMTAEVLMTSKSRIPPSIEKSATISSSLPDIYPLHPTISIKPHNFYELLDLYPASESSLYKHVHTALLHFNPSEVKNIYETEVTTDQANGRLMLKAFCLAACEARRLQKGNITDPVTVQVAQVDTKNVTFGVYQLNTLNVEDDTSRNVFWISTPVPLYTECAYNNGRPTLEGYNPDVVKRLATFMSTC